jgi:hypothetical protein
MIKAHHRPDDPYTFIYNQGWEKWDRGDGTHWVRIETEDYLRIHSKNHETVILIRPCFGEIEITGLARDAALLFAIFIRNQIAVQRDADSVYSVPLKEILKFSRSWQILENDEPEFVEEFNRIINVVLLLS